MKNENKQMCSSAQNGNENQPLATLQRSSRRQSTPVDQKVG
ncbi:MAG: hypothetical protein ACI8UQ_001796 [Bacteroidia bacterium]|jgi:hypothetical protein